MSAVALIAVIFVLSALCQWTAWKLNKPAIVLLLPAGILAGPVTGLLNTDAVFGTFLLPFVSLSTAIILFEGSLTLELDLITGPRNMLSVCLFMMLSPCLMQSGPGSFMQAPSFWVHFS